MSFLHCTHSCERPPRARKILFAAKMRIGITSLGLVFGLSSNSVPGFGQTVTLADLQGAEIDFRSVHRERLIRNGQDFYVDLHTTGHVTVGPGETITSSLTSNSVRDGHTRQGRTASGTFKLGTPRKTNVGDDTVWLFSGSSLTRLKVYGEGEGGGQKLTITFRRAPEGLRCNFAMPFARENGVGKIDKSAAVDGVPIRILEWKPVSSNCQVTKR